MMRATGRGGHWVEEGVKVVCVNRVLFGLWCWGAWRV